MAVTVTVNGTSRTTTIQSSLHISQTANGHDTVQVTVPSVDSTYRSSLDQSVEVAIGSDTWFGGIITGIREDGLAGTAPSGIQNHIDATDYNQLASERYALEDFPSQTIKQRLGVIIANYLGAAGVTIHGSQADGIVLPAVSYRYVRIDTILSEISTAAEGWVWDISPTKVLYMFQPGTLAAPFNITMPPTTWEGDLSVSPTRTEYANRVIVDTGTLTSMSEDTTAQASVGRIVEAVVSAPDTTTQAQADSLSAGYLAQLLITLKRVEYSTRHVGQLIPGMIQTITVPQRNINNTFLITDVNTSHDGAGWVSRVSAIEGSIYHPGWQQFYRSGGGPLSSVGGFGGGGGGSTNRRYAYPLGGNVDDWVSSSAPTWVPISEYVAQMDTVTRGSTSAVVCAQVRAKSGSITARLQNVSDSTTAGTSAAITNPSLEFISFAATLTAGTKLYRLEVLPSVARVDVQAVGAYVE